MTVVLSYLIRTIVCTLVLGISLLQGDIALAYEEPDYEVVKTENGVKSPFDTCTSFC